MLGLTAKQLIASILSVLVGGIIVFLTYKKVGLTLSAYIAIPVVAPIALSGFYTYNGMSFMQVMKKRIQFMFLGELIKLKFEFYGPKIEPVLDRLPTATILEQDFDKYVIEAEVYGKGIVMWLFSQSSSIKVLSPPSLVEEMKDELRRLSNMYNL